MRGCATALVFVGGVFLVFHLAFRDIETGALPEPVQAVEGQPMYGWTDVNIREAASTSTPVVESVLAGEEIRVTNLQDGWWTVNGPAGAIGFVSASVVREERLPDDVTVAVMAQDYVDDRLKAPRTAEFERPRIEHLGGGQFVVTGYVDAENSFGAMIRNTYRVELSTTDGVNWRLGDLRLY